MGADGGLGLWEAEAGCSGPWRRQEDPGCLLQPPSQKALGQDREAHLYQRAEAENVSSNPKDNEWPCQGCLPPQVSLKTCQPLALWPLSDPEAQLQGMGQEISWTEA